MTLKDLEFFKQLLLSCRKELLRQIKNIQESEREASLKEAAGDHSAYAFHMADLGSDSNEHENNFLCAERDGRFLYHIDLALERIDAGKYGLCETCGKSIGRDRLEVVPHARLCIQCKEKEEKSSFGNEKYDKGNRWAYTHNSDYHIDDDADMDIDMI